MTTKIYYKTVEKVETYDVPLMDEIQNDIACYLKNNSVSLVRYSLFGVRYDPECLDLEVFLMNLDGSSISRSTNHQLKPDEGLKGLLHKIRKGLPPNTFITLAHHTPSGLPWYDPTEEK